MEYKTNFIGRSVVEVLWIGTQIVFFEAVFSQVGLLKGWNHTEMLFFCGSMFLVDGFYMMTLHDNMTGFGRLMRSGLFDFYLLRPVSALFLGVFRNVNAISMVNMAFGIGVSAWAIRTGDLSLSGTDLLVWAFYLLLGAWMVVMLGVFIMSFGFWVVHTQPLVWLFFEFYRLSFRPDDLYAAWLRRILLSVFPAALFVSMPVRLALGKETGTQWMLYPVVAVITMTSLAVFTWNRGIKRYEGAMG